MSPYNSKFRSYGLDCLDPKQDHPQTCKEIRNKELSKTKSLWGNLRIKEKASELLEMHYCTVPGTETFCLEMWRSQAREQLLFS